MTMRIGLLAVCVLCALGLGLYWSLALGFDFAWGEHYRWLGRYYWHHGTLPEGFGMSSAVALGALIAGLSGLLILTGGAGARTLAGGHGQRTVHGSASWAGKRDLRKAGLFAKRGVVVGGWRRSPNAPVRTLRHDGPEHVLAFAPTRSGKQWHSLSGYRAFT